MSQTEKTSQTRQPGQDDATRGGQGVAASQNSPGTKREVSATGKQNGQVTRAQPKSTVMPAVDIFEDESGFTVIADMPGVSKDQLEVRVTGDGLLIEGTASVPDIGNMELVYGEVQTPQYRRSFTLSRELDPSKIEARLSNGVLRLRIPKGEEAKPRRIEVSAG